MRALDEIRKELFSMNDERGSARFSEIEQELLEYSNPVAEALRAACRGRIAAILGKPAEAIEECERAYHAFDELGDRHSSAILLGWTGATLNLAGEYERAIETLNRALELVEELGDINGIGHHYNNLSASYYGLGDFPKSLEMIRRALAAHQRTGNRKQVMAATMNIGVIHLNTADYPTALECFLECLSGIESNGPTQTMESCLNNIGIVYYNMSEFGKASEFFQRALETARTLGIETRAARCIGNIGNCFSEQGDYEAALVKHQLAHEIYAANDVEVEVTRSLIMIAKQKISLGSFDEAVVILQDVQSTPVARVVDKIDVLLLNATLQDHAGDQDAAIVILETALQLARSHSLRKAEGSIHWRLRELAHSKNDLAKYVEHNDAYGRISEEIRGKDAAQRIAMQEAERRLAAERQETAKQLAVLHSTLPKHIADRVVRGEVVNDHFDNAAVLFIDIVGFTTLSASMTSADVVNLLDTVFASFDAICQKHGVTKIKTIGDSYMAVAFPNTVPRDARDDSSSEQRIASLEERAASAALAMLDAVSHIHSDLPNGPLGDLPNGLLEDLPNGLLGDLPNGLLEDLPKGLQVRIGLHSGPVTAGIIGKERMQYDVWGDTVNVASRMESTSEPGKIHVSSSFALALKSEREKERNSETAVIPSLSEERGSKYMTPGTWHMEPRGEVEIKGKGVMSTYWLEAKT